MNAVANQPPPGHHHVAPRRGRAAEHERVERSLRRDAQHRITAWIDDKRIVNDAFDQYPLRPGPHKVKVSGPRGKTERFEVIIEATKTVTKTFEW